MRDDPLGAWLRGEDAAPAADPPGTAPSALGDDVPLDVDESAGPRRRWRFAVLVAVPWVLVAALGLVAVGRGAAGTADDDPAAARAATDPPSPSGSPPAPTPAPGEVGPPSSSAAEGAARAAAVLAVRAAVTDGAPASAPRYVDLAVAETVDRVGDLAVVTVAAVVLEGDDRRWRRAREARFAVPLATAGPTVAPAGPVWPLPVAAPDAPALSWSPGARAAPDAVALALADAGYADVGAVALSHSSAVPGVVRAEARAVAPGERDAADHTVLLRDGDPPVVLGARVAADAGPVDAPTRGSSPPSSLPSAAPEVPEVP